MKAQHYWLGVAAVLLTLWLLLALGALLQWRIYSDQHALALKQRVQAAQLQQERAVLAGLELRLQSLASDRPLVAYVVDAISNPSLPGGSIDSASISDLLVERQQQSGFGWLGVTDVRGQWIAGTRPWGVATIDMRDNRVFQAARQDLALHHGLQHDGRRWFVSAFMPLVQAGNTEAFLYAAIPINGSFLAAVLGDAPASVALIVRRPEPALHALVPANSTLESRLLDTLRSGAWRPEPAAQMRLARDTSLHAVPFFDGPDGAVLILAVAQPWRYGSAGVLLWWGLGLLLSLALLLGAVLLRRRVLLPVEQACDLLERCAEGDFHLQAPAWKSGPGARFARAFHILSARLRQH